MFPYEVDAMVQKFTEFYYSVDKKTHPANDVTDIHESEYKNGYKNKIFCPKCHVVPLLLCQCSKKIFLKAFPKREHGLVDGGPCPFIPKEKLSSIDTSIAQNIRDTNRIDSILASALRSLDKNSITKPESETSGETPSETEPKSENKRDHKRQSRPPRISWTNWNKDLPSYYHVVYGKVKVRIVTVEKDIKNENDEIIKESHRFIRIYTIKPYRLVASIKADNVALDMKDGTYNLVVYAKPWVYKGYVNCDLKYSNSIKYSRLSSD